MEQTDTPKRRNDYKIRSDRTWTLIRERYLAGQSAPRLAGVFDVTEAAIRRRAGRQGWTKRSLAEATPPEPADAGLADAVAGLLDGDLTPREAARLALGEAVKLLRGGRMGLAGEAARVADVMGRAAARLDDEAADPGEPDEAAFEAVRRKVLGLASPSAEADGEDRSARERRPGGGDAGGRASGGASCGGEDAGGPRADIESPPPDRCAVSSSDRLRRPFLHPNSPDANGEVKR